MSNLTIYQYKVFCITENTFKYVLLDETQDPPTTCPINTAHTIDSSQTTIIEKRDSKSFFINQESSQTGSHYRMVSFNFSVNADSTTSETVQIPFDINVLNGTFVSSEENKNDHLTITFAPNAVIGYITSNVSIGNTIINVSPTVFDYISKGFYVNLFNNISQVLVDCGHVLSLNKDAGTITVENPSTANLTAAVTVSVRMNITVVDDIIIGPPHTYNFGREKNVATFLPANTKLRFTYTNLSEETNKNIIILFEYLY